MKVNCKRFDSFITFILLITASGLNPSDTQFSRFIFGDSNEGEIRGENKRKLTSTAYGGRKKDRISSLFRLHKKIFN
jgi:hypothetical protein